MKYLLLLLSLLYFAPGFSQMEELKIYWNEDRLLTWEDFQGPPDSKVPFHASTSSGIGFSWSMKSSKEGTEFKYEITNSFNPDRSWVKEGKESEHLLAHEQLHFDISELHARKFRKELKAYKITKSIKQDLNTIYTKNERARQKMQRSFDSETKHSQNKEAQEKWQTFIASELNRLEAFAL